MFSARVYNKRAGGIGEGNLFVALLYGYVCHSVSSVDGFVLRHAIRRERRRLFDFIGIVPLDGVPSDLLRLLGADRGCRRCQSASTK